MRLAVVLILILVSCNQGLEKPTPPNDLIEREKLVQVIKDLVKLEGHMQNKYGRIDRYYKTLDRSGKELLKENEISPEQFENSMKYYAEDQDEMDAIYGEALNLLNKELGELQQN